MMAVSKALYVLSPFPSFREGMSQMLQARRLAFSLATGSFRPYRRSISTLRSSAYHVEDQSPRSSSSPPPPGPVPAQNKSSWRFLTNGISAALLGASAAAGYATYTYTADQVEEKTKAFRDSVKNQTKEDASSVEKFEALLYTAAMTVPTKCIKIYLDLRRSIEELVQGYVEPISDKLLPDLPPEEQRVLTLVLDLNETLVYTDWKRERGWRTFKRPGVDVFLERLGQFYEIVIYTDQPDMYVEPVLSRLDQKQVIRHKLSRSATKYQDGKHFRDLSKLNRDPSRILYVSGHALESALQPENCAPIKPWKCEEGDTTLIDLMPFLEFVAREYYSRQSPIDVRQVLSYYKGCDIATEFNNRQRQMLDNQKPVRHLWSR